MRFLLVVILALFLAFFWAIVKNYMCIDNNFGLEYWLFHPDLLNLPYATFGVLVSLY